MSEQKSTYLLDIHCEVVIIVSLVTREMERMRTSYGTFITSHDLLTVLKH